MPLVRVVGWAVDELPALFVRTSRHAKLPCGQVCKVSRPDIVAAGISADPYCGFRAEFFIEPGDQVQTLQIGEAAELPIPHAESYGSVRPHYETLLTETRVLHRGDIYGYGPPTDSTPEIKGLLKRVTGRALDFGCGNGDSLLSLRDAGCDARGVELDSPRIQGALKADARPFTTLYAGGIPLPFDDGRFDWIVSIEVIEHIPDIEAYVPEFARLLGPGGRLFLTTPDMTSIPVGFTTGTVPWHLLESTHVRFFTPRSLTNMLGKYFDLEELYSIGDNQVNGWVVPGSIAGVFRKRLP